MAKAAQSIDVLVLGQHPCAYLAAELLAPGAGAGADAAPAKSAKGAFNVAHATIPGDTPPDRLVLLNPQLFALHKPLEKLKKKLELAGVWGTAFLSEDPSTRG